MCYIFVLNCFPPGFAVAQSRGNGVRMIDSMIALCTGDHSYGEHSSLGLCVVILCFFRTKQVDGSSSNDAFLKSIFRNFGHFMNQFFSTHWFFKVHCAKCASMVTTVNLAMLYFSVVQQFTWLTMWRYDDDEWTVGLWKVAKSLPPNFGYKNALSSVFLDISIVNAMPLFSP